MLNHYRHLNHNAFTSTRSLLTFTIITWIVTFSGCSIAPFPYLPNTWIDQSYAIKTTTWEPKKATLQVYITDTHVALRLVSSSAPDTFWDPGGDYGLFDDDWGTRYAPLPEGIKRARDLIVEKPPDMETFVRWRWVVEDGSVEVFEWDLSASQASSLRDVLIHGTDDTHSAGEFSTSTFPMFCAIATSDFLQRFVSPTIQLPEQYFFPRFLAEALYAQAPSRVYAFTWDGYKAIYVPPGPTSARQ